MDGWMDDTADNDYVNCSLCKHTHTPKIDKTPVCFFDSFQY